MDFSIGLDGVQLASQVPEVNTLGSEVHEVCNGCKSVEPHKFLVESIVLPVLLENLHFVFLDFPAFFSCLLLLLKHVFFECDFRCLGFKVEEVRQNHYERSKE